MPRPRSVTTSNGQARIGPPRVAIVVSRYNATITDKLLEGARSTFAVHFPLSNLEVIPSPGSFELPALALAAAKTGRFQGIVALGCLIKGETAHDRIIADAVAQGLIQVTIATGVPVTFGVLTTDTPEQALARAGGNHGNKGADAMSALLDTLAAMDTLARKPRDSIPGFLGSSPPKPDKAARHRSRR